MKKYIVLSAVVFLTAAKLPAQSAQHVFTDDIDHFWTAYDSIKTTSDSIKQLYFINTLYIDKGSEGLKAFMKARDYSAALWIKLINKLPKFWNSIRPNTLTVKTKAKEIEASIAKFQKLYPQLKEAKMYFTIGGLRSGGTTSGNMVLIGTEIASGTAATDVSEFTSKWLEGVFKDQSLDNIISLNIHEYVHTQQNGESENLLAQCITEGSCDFITELVIGKPMQNNYIQYGRLHETELKEKFKEQMFTRAFSDWLYNGSNATTIADLGYFMGYTICRSYYAQAKDKKKAIKAIIELNYSDTAAVENFLAASKYFTAPYDKAALLEKYKAQQPVLTLVNITNGDTATDPSITEFTFNFSKPMRASYSIDISEKGKDAFPITGVKGYSADKKTFTVKTALLPHHDYEFIITGRSFISEDGYPLADLPVKFTTK